VHCIAICFVYKILFKAQSVNLLAKVSLVCQNVD